MSILEKLGILAAILLSGSVVGWVAHGWKYDAEQSKLKDSLIAATAKNDELKTQLGVKHEQERKDIANAAATLAAGRVRLPKGCVQSIPATGSSISTTGTGELPDAHQQALDRFKRGVDEVVRDADEMLASCRVVMEWAKAQNR